MANESTNGENHMNSADEPPEFDPSIDMVIAETWWALGKRINAFHPDEPADHRSAAALEWIAHLFKDSNSEDWYDDARAALTPEQLRTFAEDLHGLLERKYRGESIGNEVLERVRPSSNFTFDESDQFLELRESVEVWWANEYRQIFFEMERYERKPNWTVAAANCANEACGRFFIKRRPNQRYHSEACQARAANQRSYRKHRSTMHRPVASR
jgi:hypothetical protein